VVELPCDYLAGRGPVTSLQAPAVLPNTVHWTGPTARTRRRAFLATTATDLGTALAGCSGDDGDSGQGNLDSYRDRLDAELDVTIRQLSVDGRVVTLRYESTHAAGTSEWGYEVGFVGGRFGREVPASAFTDRIFGSMTEE
jgi:hypothetical protein